jgi:hypothetical protein
MQPREHYQPVMVTTTLYKRMVRVGAICSSCRQRVAEHGGFKPCVGAAAVISTDLVRAACGFHRALNGDSLKKAFYFHLAETVSEVGSQYWWEKLAFKLRELMKS